MLYKNTAGNAGGMARDADEITTDYVQGNLERCRGNGICLVVENPDSEQQLLSEMHCYPIRIFEAGIPMVRFNKYFKR